MKRTFLTITAMAALTAGAAVADYSTSGQNGQSASTQTPAANVAVTVSTRGGASTVPYAYTNQFGVGPSNDSR
ncbi:MAG: hypothetical protein AAF222_13490 [Pseudomonadota bacterium]